MVDRMYISRHHGFELTDSQSIDHNISNNALPSQTSIINRSHHRSHKHKVISLATINLAS